MAWKAAPFDVLRGRAPQCCFRHSQHYFTVFRPVWQEQFNAGIKRVHAGSSTLPAQKERGIRFGVSEVSFV
jgi:hypothetical protein